MTPKLNASTTSGYQKTKRTDTKLLTPGHNLCRLYAIIDTGEQLNPSFGKYVRKVDFLFEFPYLVQFYYEEDEVRKPAGIRSQFTLSFHPKSILRPFVDNMLGKRMSDADANVFNIFSLVDQYYIANVIHQASKKNDGKVYENINGISKYDPRFLEPEKELLKYNDVILYSIDEHGFAGENWLSVPFWIQKKIRESKQGLDHIASGGTFQEKDRDGNSGGSNNVQKAPQRNQQQGQVNQMPQQAQGQPQQPNQPQGQPEQPQQAQGQPQQPNQQSVTDSAEQQPQVRMLGQVPLNAFISKGWTLQQIVSAGHAEYISEVVQAPPVNSGQPNPMGPSGQPQVGNSVPQGNIQQPPSSMANVSSDGPEGDLPF